MKRISLMFVSILLGVVLLGEANARQASGRPEITTEKLVHALRLLNTHEASYMYENGRFADREQMLSYLRQKGLLSRSPLDLENPKPYELATTISPDGVHYQIALQRPSDMNDESTWCKTAAFSDDKGVIYLGQAIGCNEASSAYKPHIRRIRYLGIKSISEVDIENAYKDNKITLSVETRFDAEKLTHAATVIQELLAAHSHPSATIKPTYERTASSNEVTILFTIDEGPKAQPSTHPR
jgi:hypothetical protein